MASFEAFQEARVKEYEVVVGNLGIVYSGTDGRKAVTTYFEYIEISKAPHGRASGESVVLFADGEIVREFGQKETQ